MPILDGIEACIMIRNIEKTQGGHVPIVGLTADIQRETLDEFLAAGCDYGM